MITYQQIASKFVRMGAQASIREMTKQDRRRFQRPLAVDVVEQHRGEAFEILLAPEVELRVLDAQPKSRHLLLSARNVLGEDRFLCGHDEFHWFAAALPGDPDVRSVVAAKEALKPRLVTRLEGRKLRGKRPRRSDLFFRQGEWFFIPWRHASVDPRRIEEYASLVRGPRSKPHVCQFLYRDGEPEYECARYPKLAFFESEYRRILRTRRKARQWKWRQLPFRPDIYVKGQITHADHSTLVLDIWHRVELNRESSNLAMSRMVYRD